MNELAKQDKRRRFDTGLGSRLLPGRASPLIDIVMVATPFLAILIQLLIGPLTPLLVFGVTGAFMVLRWEQIYPSLTHCWPLLLLPLFAIASVAWSESPAATLRYGTLYFLTILPAVFIGAGLDRMAMLKGVFCAFAIYMILSLVLGRYVNWSGQGAVAFAGLLGSKNASGDVGALTVLISVTMLIWGRRWDRKGWAIAALLVLPMGIFTLWASKATGALVATIIALPCLLLWIASRHLDLRLRVSIFAIAIFLVGLLLATFDYWMVPLFELVLENSGKNAGLTGRDLLWSKADQLIAQSPFLGNGYKGFWVLNNLDAEYLWRAMGISNRSGFNFHNTPRDILVDLGFVGLALFSIVVIYASIRLVIGTMKNPTYPGIFCCTILIFESPRIFFELLGFQDMHFSTLIMFMVFAYGMRPAKLSGYR